MKIIKTLICLTITGMFALPVMAAPPVEPKSEDFQSLRSTNMFTPLTVIKPNVRTAVKPVEKVEPPSDWALRGLMKLEQGWMVVIVNKKDASQRYSLYEGKEYNGLKLISVEQNETDYLQTKVQIEEDGRPQELNFSEKDMASLLSRGRSSGSKAPIKKPSSASKGPSYRGRRPSSSKKAN